MRADPETSDRGVEEPVARPGVAGPLRLASVLVTMAAVAAVVTVPLLAHRVSSGQPADPPVPAVQNRAGVALQGGAKLSRDGRVLTVVVFGGGCSGPFSVAADQQPDRVVLAAVDRYRSRREWCVASLTVVSLQVTLDRPLGQRRVVDGATGRTLPVYPTLRLGYLPPGHLGESDCIPELPQPTAQSADLAGCTFRFSEDPGLPGLAVSYTTAPLPDYGDIAWDPPTGTTLNGQPATLRVGRIPAKPGGRPQYERWLTWTSRGIYYTVRTMVDGSPNTLLPAVELVKIGQSLR